MNNIFYGAIALAVGCLIGTLIYFLFENMDKILNKLFRKKVIHDCDGSPYMHRWFVIRNMRFAIFIHKFIRSDFDRALHDHPWDFLVIPIWRGYIEHHECEDCQAFAKYTAYYGGKSYPCPEPTSHRVWPIIGIRFRRGEYRHRVELFKRDGISEHTRAIVPDLEEFKPSWSIFIRFRKRRAWGFWMKNGWVHNETWWKANCGEEKEAGE